ncbi:MAG: hypothetical protein WB005_25010, partial [Pseudolabrys sp.]
MEPSFDRSMGRRAAWRGRLLGLLTGCLVPNQIAIMDHLAEWMRQHLDARFASAQLYDPKL